MADLVDLLVSVINNDGADALVAHLQDGGDPDWQYRDVSLLTLAIRKKSVRCVRALIQEGADVSDPGKYGWTPLHYACADGYAEIVSLLIQANAPIDTKNCNGQTPLMLASFNGYLDCVKMLAEKGADLTLAERDGVVAFDPNVNGVPGLALDSESGVKKPE